LFGKSTSGIPITQRCKLGIGYKITRIHAMSLCFDTSFLASTTQKHGSDLKQSLNNHSADFGIKYSLLQNNYFVRSIQPEKSWVL
jgi:hypothetical protein